MVPAETGEHRRQGLEPGKPATTLPPNTDEMIIGSMSGINGKGDTFTSRCVPAKSEEVG